MILVIGDGHGLYTRRRAMLRGIYWTERYAKLVPFDVLIPQQRCENVVVLLHESREFYS